MKNWHGMKNTSIIKKQDVEQIYAVYKRGMDSDFYLPWIISSVKVAPLAAAAVVPPRLPECSP